MNVQNGKLSSKAITGSRYVPSSQNVCLLWFVFSLTFKTALNITLQIMHACMFDTCRVMHLFSLVLPGGRLAKCSSLKFQHFSPFRYIELLTKHKTEKLVWEEDDAEHSFWFTWVENMYSCTKRMPGNVHLVLSTGSRFPRPLSQECPVIQSEPVIGRAQVRLTRNFPSFHDSSLGKNQP